MQDQPQTAEKKLLKHLTPMYLRHARSRVQRWARNRHKPGRDRSVPRHIHEKAMHVREYMALLEESGTRV